MTSFNFVWYVLDGCWLSHEREMFPRLSGSAVPVVRHFWSRTQPSNELHTFSSDKRNICNIRRLDWFVSGATSDYPYNSHHHLIEESKYRTACPCRSMFGLWKVKPSTTTSNGTYGGRPPNNKIPHGCVTSAWWRKVEIISGEKDRSLNKITDL